MELLTRQLVILTWSSGERLGWRSTFVSHWWVDGIESYKPEQDAQGSVCRWRSLGCTPALRAQDKEECTGQGKLNAVTKSTNSSVTYTIKVLSFI